MFLTLVGKQLNKDNSYRIAHYYTSIKVLKTTTSDCTLIYFYKNWPVDTSVLFLDLLLTHAKNKWGSKSDLTWIFSIWWLSANLFNNTFSSSPLHLPLSTARCSHLMQWVKAACPIWLQFRHLYNSSSVKSSMYQEMAPCLSPCSRLSGPLLSTKWH